MVRGLRLDRIAAALRDLAASPPPARESDTIPDLPHIAGQDLALISAAYGLGDVHAVSYLSTGLMNRNWRLTTTQGEYALKRILDVSAAAARRSAHVVAALHERGIPVCPPVLSAEGDPVVEIEGRAYCLLPWFDGQHPAGADLTLAQAGELGDVVGQIHQALNEPCADLPPAPASPVVREELPDAAIAVARRFQHAARTAGGTFDIEVADALEQRIALIGRYAGRRPTGGRPSGLYGWTHGDLQYRNILWHDGRIGAVIDWDRIGLRPFAHEIIRTVTIQFGTPDGLDLPRASAFIDAYGGVVPIHGDDLADGAHRLWWHRLTDYWHLVYRYDRGDHSCDDLFLPGEALLTWWTDHYDEVTNTCRGIGLAR